MGAHRSAPHQSTVRPRPLLQPPSQQARTALPPTGPAIPATAPSHPAPSPNQWTRSGFRQPFTAISLSITVGNVSSFSDSVMGNWGFTYDNLNRLSTGTSPAPPPNYLCWTYDSFGNRTTQLLEFLTPCSQLSGGPAPSATLTPRTT